MIIKPTLCQAQPHFNLSPEKVYSLHTAAGPHGPHAGDTALWRLSFNTAQHSTLATSRDHSLGDVKKCGQDCDVRSVWKCWEDWEAIRAENECVLLGGSWEVGAMGAMGAMGRMLEGGCYGCYG